MKATWKYCKEADEWILLETAEGGHWLGFAYQGRYGYWFAGLSVGGSLVHFDHTYTSLKAAKLAVRHQLKREGRS